MRVVFDTNIVVSSSLSPKGIRAGLIQKWKDNNFDLVVSEAILKEYKKALSYQDVSKKHQMSVKEINQLIRNFRKFALVVSPKTKIKVIKDDPDDNKFLESAEEGRAEIIVGADKHLLDLSEYQGIKILSATEFLLYLSS